MLDAYPPELQEFVLSKIASGEFRSVDEFAVEAAALYRDVDRRREKLKEEVEAAIAEIDAGQSIEINDETDLREFVDGVKRRGRERLAREQHGE
jgi:Arc/MetJ-type ribon-helix-helix transcriptional regulator